MNLQTAGKTYRQLVGNGLIYSVPRFQRDYSWGPTEWEDLWADIENLFAEDGEEEHYMGYLVLQSADNKHFRIIDGQQRLTTLSIIVLAVLAHLKNFIRDGIAPEENEKRLEQLRNIYIGYVDPVTLIAESKLKLNRNNDDLYQKYLVPLEPLPARGLKATERLMKKAYEWFFERIKQFSAKNRDGRALAAFIDQLSDKLFFTVITVNDELNAYKVFETLNARGVQLSSTDLLKNYLFSVVHKDGGSELEMEELDKRWEHITGIIGSDSLPNFLRAYWNSRNRFVRHAELFKRIRAKIISKGQVFELLRKMEVYAHLFAALRNPEDELWQPEQRTHVKLLRLFNVRQLYPLLMSAWGALKAADFTRMLRYAVVISFRYNVIGQLPPNEQERLYNQIAVQISSGDLTSIQRILQALKAIYVPDEKFKLDFSEKEFRTTQARNKKIVRYILFEIERHITSGDACDMDNPAFTIEHIMPENIEHAWEDIDDKEHQLFLYRLGNMTLLEAKLNKQLGNASFSEKRKKYKESTFAITRKVADDNAFWNAERIAARQRWMAKQAAAIWKID